MDKKPRKSKASMKIFQTDSSSRETTPDPFSDDGNYGSDQDYDPEPVESNDSDSSVSNEVHIRSKSRGGGEYDVSVSDGSTSEGSSESCDSIFDRAKRRKIKSNHSPDVDTADADTSSIDVIEAHPGSPLRVAVELCSTPPALPPPADIEDYLAPLVSPPPADIEDNPSPPASTPPADIEDNPAPLASPPPADIEDNPSPPASPSPADAEDNPGSSASPPAVDIEDNPAPRQSRSRSRDIQANRQRRPRRRTPSPVTGDWEETTSDIPTFDFDDVSAGAQFELGPTTSIMDVFNKMFPPHIVDFIVTSTNDYGNALCSTNRPTTRNSRRYRYKETNREEILKFLGLCLLMGQVNVPKKSKLFTYSDPLYYHPIFQYAMSARRFEQLLRCLYMSQVGAKGKEKIIKFIDAMTKNFRECYKPTRELSLDESMLLFRGRLSFRQYIKSKKARYGIKFYELTTSDGYVLNLIMYTGKDDENENVIGKKTEKTVMHLMRPYLLKGHFLFMDNYYNSVNLSQKLLDLKTHTTGTLRSNRKDNPKDLTKKKLKKNEHFWVRKNKVYVSKWQDKRSVLMVTTLNHPKLIEITNRRGQRRMKPEEVTTYNKYMSGIDRADQMVSYYSTPRKSLRWYKKVFFHLLDLAVWNSFFLYKKYCKNNSKRYELLSFRDALIKELIKLPPNLQPAMLIKTNRYDNRLKERNEFLPSASARNDENNDNFGHWPEKIPVRANSKKTTNYMKCKMCSKKKIRRETSLRCQGCEEKPALCAICFQEWHSQF